jgi:hypothetical protein
MTHHFPIDPRSILGVGEHATPEETHRAYVTKSKKHHPDAGGDEWAFRIVARAYELLKSTGLVGEQPVAHAAANGEPIWGQKHAYGNGPDDRWVRSPRETADGRSWREATSNESEEEDSGPTCTAGAEDFALLAELRTVEIEMVWIRFALPESRGHSGEQKAADSTLSVCMVITWPRRSLLARAAEVPETAETLRIVIESFEHLRGQQAVLASRSRIEDGQFVGWLSYPDVAQALMGFQAVKDALARHQLKIKLQTRDESIPCE